MKLKLDLKAVWWWACVLGTSLHSIDLEYGKNTRTGIIPSLKKKSKS